MSSFTFIRTKVFDLAIARVKTRLSAVLENPEVDGVHLYRAVKKLLRTEVLLVKRRDANWLRRVWRI